MNRRFALLFCVGLVSSVPAPARSTERAPVVRSQLKNRLTAVALERALPRAAQKLADPKCAAVLSEFKDAYGRPLSDNLGALGETPPGYLKLIVFADGHLRPSCAKRDNLAVTGPGSRVVYLCPQFARGKGGSDSYRGNILIHEALHSLGLSENPPTTAEITRRVEARCGR
jgi:hypothetical protein